MAPRTIGILLFENVEELDAVGPWEVCPGGRANIRKTATTSITMADTLDPVTCAKGLRIMPRTSRVADAPPSRC